MVTKKTDIGVLPSDWSVVTLLDCLCGKPSYGINAPAIAYSPQKPRYIRITDITEAGTYSKSSPVWRYLALIFIATSLMKRCGIR